jgi:hypothetical protein
VLLDTGSSHEPGSSQIFRHLGTTGHIRAIGRIWTAGLAVLGQG